MKDFFISYNAADRAWAEWIAWQLESSPRRWSVIVQAWDFRPGGNFALDMHNALAGTERTIIVLSPSFLQSEYAAAEWAATFARDPTGTKRLLVPVRVRECQPGGLLAQIVYIDLVGVSDRNEARRKLLEGLEARVKPETEPPLPPLDTTSAAPNAPEPPWPPAIEAAARAAGGLLKRLLRSAAVCSSIALATWLLLATALPGYVHSQPGAAALVSVEAGAAAALVVEIALQLLRRRSQRVHA